MADTARDDEPRRAGARVRLLTWVARTDDLLADTGKVFTLRGPEIKLVRGEAPGVAYDANQALKLGDAKISSSHATLVRRGEGTWLVDHGSRNGTFVDGERVEGEVALRDRAMVQLGPFLFCYREVPDRTARLVTDAAVAFGPTRTSSPELAEVLRQLELVANSREPVLIIAETGSGKEVAARHVHQVSARKGPLVAIDCGALPDSLFESTLFGHEKGAFTGANEARIGQIAHAHRGTLFLDEVGNLTPGAQAKLLRVLETAQVTALGSNNSAAIDVRWVAATNAELFDGKEFRSDLVHRLAGYLARLPPLRERREDLGVLSAFFLREVGVTQAAITSAAARLLFLGPLPGNVRQLRAALRSAVLLAKSDAEGGKITIDVAHLPNIRSPGPANGDGDADADEADAPKTPRKPPTAAEIEKALDEAGGNVSRAARLLQTYPRQLYRWMEGLSLSIDKYRK